MAFPLTYRGKLEFVLHGDPDSTVERFYEDASFKIERSLAIDAAVEVAAAGGKLVVSYTVKFKKILVIVSVFVPVVFAIYFSIWDILIPPDWPRSWGQRGVAAAPPTVIHMLAVMGFYWLRFFGGVYLIIAARFRSLLRATWRDLKLP